MAWMEFLEWLIPWPEWRAAVSVSTIMSGIGFCCAVVYKKKVEKGIDHRFDQKLEVLRSELRKNEEEHKADLRRRDEAIAAIRNGAITGMFSRISVVDARRLEAVERVWSAVVDFGNFKSLVRSAAVLKMDVLIERSEKNDEDGEKIRKFAEMILQNAGEHKLENIGEISKERPFLSPLVWALFSAYSSIISLSYVQFKFAQQGIGHEMLDYEGIAKVLKAAVPDCSSYLDQHGISAVPHLIDLIEEKLLSAVIDSISHSFIDRQTVEHAIKILSAVDEISMKVKNKELDDLLSSVI